jgi:phage baseplate assembly protein W
MQNIGHIDSRDLEDNQALGVKLPFARQSVFTSTYNTKDALRTNLINYLLTNKQESIMNPTRGTNLRKFIFSQTTPSTLEDFQGILREELILNFEMLNIIDLKITANLDSNSVLLELHYNRNNVVEDEDTITIQIT